MASKKQAACHCEEVQENSILDGVDLEVTRIALLHYDTLVHEAIRKINAQMLEAADGDV